MYAYVARKSGQQVGACYVDREGRKSERVREWLHNMRQAGAQISAYDNEAEYRATIKPGELTVGASRDDLRVAA